MDARISQGGLTAARVGEMGVAPVDDDVSGLQQPGVLGDHVIGRMSGQDHDDQSPGPFQRGHHLLRAGRGNERAFMPEVADEGAGALRRPVGDGYGVAVTCQVAGEVAPHDGKADDTYLSAVIPDSFLIDREMRDAKIDSLPALSSRG